MKPSGLNLKVDVSDTDFIEVIDELDSVLYPHELLAQYFSDLFNELALRTASKTVMLKKTIFLEVSYYYFLKIVHETSWNVCRQNIQQI